MAAYFKIPNFEFSHLATVETVADRMACQRICNSSECNSYVFSIAPHDVVSEIRCSSYSYREATSAEEEEAQDTTPMEDKEEKAENLKEASKTPPTPKGVCKWSPESLHYRLGWDFYTKAKDVDWQGQPHLTTENFHKFPGLEYEERNFKMQKDKTMTECRDTCAQG